LSPKKIVITGGPSTGKTSLIEAMQNSGYFCYPEVIRQMTLDAKKNGSLSNYETNPIASVVNPLDFNNKILAARLDQYRESQERQEPFVFFDRGMPDILAYMNYYGQVPPQEFTSVIKNHRYNLIFHLPMWRNIFVHDDERFESYADALKINECLLDTYNDLNYEVIEIPKSSVVERVKFLQKIVDNDAY